MPLDGTLYEDEILKTLNEAQDRIRDPMHWTKGVLARDSQGHVVEPTDKHAVRFCSYGAFCATRRENTTSVIDFVDRVSYSIGHLSMADINDNCGHSMVMKLFDTARATREAKIREEELVLCL